MMQFQGDKLGWVWVSAKGDVVECTSARKRFKGAIRVQFAMRRRTDGHTTRCDVVAECEDTTLYFGSVGRAAEPEAGGGGSHNAGGSSGGAAERESESCRVQTVDTVD